MDVARGSDEGAWTFTTLRFSNVPRKFTSWDMLAELARFTLPETIEFVYVPWSNGQFVNLGYAFAIFGEGAHAFAVHRRAEGVPWSCSASRRLIRSGPSETQGVAGNLERFLLRFANQLEDPPEPPLVFEEGVLLSLELASCKYHVSQGGANQPRHQLRAQWETDCVLEDEQIGGASLDLRP